MITDVPFINRVYIGSNHSKDGSSYVRIILFLHRQEFVIYVAIIVSITTLITLAIGPNVSTRMGGGGAVNWEVRIKRLKQNGRRITRIHS